MNCISTPLLIYDHSMSPNHRKKKTNQNQILTSSRTEHQMGTRKRRAEIAKSESEQEISESDLTTAPVPTNPDEHLLQIPGSERALISLTGKGFERALLSKLDWFTYLYVHVRIPSETRI